MRKHLWRKITSVVCAAAMFISMSSSILEGSTARAAGAVLGYWPETLEYPNQYYYEGQTLQPYGTCFQIDELKNWSPDNDPDARYNRGAIPLRERWMGPNVNPKASRDAKVMPLAMGNARASQALSQGGDGVSSYNFNNFQYVTNYNFWGGSSGEGPIAIPSPELIDSAHRNGVPVTGTIFIPWGDSAYGNQFVREMVEKAADGSFPAADKLIEIAQYYGFDGYIFNAESGTGVAGFKEFLIYIQDHKPDNFTITWYNGRTSLSESDIRTWMQDGDTRIVDEWWMDMGGNGNVDSTLTAARNLGVDTWNIYSTWENWPMGAGAKGGNYMNRLDENGVLKCSLGILAPTASLMASQSPEQFLNEMDQKLWVGPDLDPSSDYYPSGEFCGFAHMVADRTPVIGTDFVTNFNAGNGYRFYENGVVTGKTGGWYNRSLGDVLPTWRWIIDTEGQKLDAIIDYADAWEGGTSLKLSGNMDAGLANHVKLYSSQLYITGRSEFSMTYKTSTPGVQMELGLCFGDTYDEQNFKFYPVETSANGQWATSTVDLSGDAGKTAIAISLRLTAPGGVTGYSINIGEMAFTTDWSAPAAAAQVTLDEVMYHSDREMEARIYWEKAAGAFIYRIYRVHADGTREFVGATPSDAFYLGGNVRDGDEAVCTFEITSYSENGVEGGSTQIAIDWPEMVENGYAPIIEEGENIALKAPALSSGNASGNGIHQLVDGTVLNGSKWCVDNTRSGYAILDLGENKTIQRWVVYHANCPGAGESPTMNTVDFDLQYAADDGGALLDNTDSSSVSRVSNLSYTVADRVTDNKQDVTDRNLAEPITARYIKLNVTNGDRSPWVAIRIYELELYENIMPEGYSSAASPNAKNITMKNGEGASDILIVDNVPMAYSSGTYADKDGVFHEDTGKVRLFTSLDAEEPVVAVNAIQPNESYKQRAVGIAKFENLDFEEQFPDGRIYYDVLDGSGGAVLHTRRASVAYSPEAGTAPAAPGSVELVPTTGSSQLRKQYAKLVAEGVETGAVLHIFDSADAETAILRTLPAQADGVIQQERVPLDKEGGSIWYEVHKDGMPDSPRYELAYSATSGMTADLAGLREWIAKCEAVSADSCTSGSYEALSQALSQAKFVAGGAPTMAEAEAARADLAAAYANLRYKGNNQRLRELCAECEGKYLEEDNAASTWAPYLAALTAAKEAIAANDSSSAEYEQLRIALESAARNLTPKFTVNGVTVSPDAAEVAKGSEKQFTATVDTSNGPVTEAGAVTWEVAGGTSDGTIISETGLLSVGADEAAETLTVKAVSVDAPEISGEAAVTVTSASGSLKNVALNARILGYTGNSGANEAVGMAFDGDDTTKWCTEGTPAWVAFDTGVAVYPEMLRVLHAGGGNPSEPGIGDAHEFDLNTRDFTFEILDPEKYTEEEFFALDESERMAVLGEDTNWIALVGVAGNTQHITEHALTADHPVQIFRMKVTDGDANWWNGVDTVRIFEVEVYGTEPVDPTENLARDAAILGYNGNSVAGEAVESAFDGDIATKWCKEKTPAWVTFDIGTAVYPNTLRIVHAGAAAEPEDERFNTRAFTFEILDPARYTEAEFLAMDETQRASVMEADSNWIALVSVTGNTESITEHALVSDYPARIYRINVTDGDENWWNGPDTVRIYEIELYGALEKAPEIVVTIEPEEVTVERTPGIAQQFTAHVEGTDNTEVAWSVSGNTSEGTMIANGLLFIGDEEAADVLIVTAASLEDPSRTASATVFLKGDEPAEHPDMVYAEAKEAACTEDGNIEYWYCADCGKYFADETAETEIAPEEIAVPAAGHRYDAPVWNWAEDDSAAEAVFTCAACGDVQAVQAEVTCADGLYTAAAVFEGQIYTDVREAELPPVCQHQLAWVNARPAACAEEGNTGYWHCGSCGSCYSDAEATVEIALDDTVIPAAGHDYDLFRWEWTEDGMGGYSVTAVFVCRNDSSHAEHVEALVHDAGEDEEGSRQFTAGALFNGQIYTDKRTVEAAPEEEHSMIYVEAADADCERSGNVEYWYCETCEAWYLDAEHTVHVEEAAVILPAVGHSYAGPEWNWTEYGAEAVFVCRNCGHEVTVAADVTVYQLDDRQVSVARAAFRGVEYTDSRETETPQPAHQLTYVPGRTPTCTENGYVGCWYCAACGKYYSDAEHANEITLADTVLPAAGHRYGAPQWTWTGYAAEALFTCQNDGSHVEYVPAAVTSETIQDNIYVDGRIIYTASVVFEGVVYTDSRVEIIPAQTPVYPPYLPVIPSTPNTPSTTTRPSATPDPTPDTSIPEDPTPMDPGTDIGDADVPLASIVLPFQDVAAGQWHRDAVAYVYSKGMMSGTSATRFEPDSSVSRGMLVTMLHRLEGTPAAGWSVFTDVLADQYYAEAVAWAAQYSVVNGTSETTFSPDQNITREQLAAILYRYAMLKGYDTSKRADLSGYTDSAAISDYALEAMRWAVAEGLISGQTAVTLAPGGEATRAEAAMILMRFCENVVK